MPFSLARSAFSEVAQHLAIGENHSIDAAHRLAIFGRDQNDRHVIPDLQRIFVPAAVDQPRRIGFFREPVSYFALIVLNVEFEPAVRVRPHPLGDDALQSKLLTRVECRVPMVRE